MKSNREKESKLTQVRLKELLEYNPQTGDFIRKVSTARRTKVGEVAGTFDKSNGYVRMCVDSERYLAHRLVFLYMNGVWPEDEVDHQNGIRDDNRLINLVLVTCRKNQRNRSLGRRNKSGVVGVSWHKTAQKWVAQIKIDGKSQYLGLFVNKEDAIEARQAANIEYNFHPNHGRRQLEY